MPRIALVTVVLAILFHSSLDGSEPAPPPPVHVTLELTDGSRIIGEPVGVTALPLKTDFATIDIPLHLIGEGAFTANRAAFQVKFKNNDTLTGALQLERLRVKTSYGEANVVVARVAKIIVRDAPKP